KRELDSTTYFTNVTWSKGDITKAQQPHTIVLNPSGDDGEFEFSVAFKRDSTFEPLNFKSTEQNSIEHWKKFWESGGAIDFSECTDPRAKELERRVVLSQYLTKIQCAGSMPPQETGLTMNSWYGKFHLEMYWWHAAHFAQWGRPALVEKSIAWFDKTMPKAQGTAKWQGYEGARWQKMTDPSGDESPSNVGAFILWQQPHPI